MHVQTYLHFPGNCEEAIAFYRSAVGAEVEMLMRYRESPEPPPPGMVPADWGDKVMHSSFRIGDSVVMASDDCTGTHAGFQGFQLSLTVGDAASGQRCFASLAEGGEVHMPMSKTFFSPSFGMLRDRFGVRWMVMVEPR